MLRALCLALWGSVLLQSAISGRLDLLLRAVFHPLVWISGGVLLLLAALELRAAASPALPGARPRPEGAAAQLRHRCAGAGPAAPALLRRPGRQPGFEPAGGAGPQLRAAAGPAQPHRLGPAAAQSAGPEPPCRRPGADQWIRVAG